MDRLNEAGDEVFERIASGEMSRAIAKSYDITWQSVLNWVNSDPELRKKYEAARRASAELAAEESVRVLEKANRGGLSTADVAAAKNYSDRLAWIAARRDRVEYGDNPQVQINNNTLNIGDLHLDALRKKGHMSQLPKGQINVIEGEVIEDDDE